jgi:K+-sensing histidine kinase KdpD
VRWGSGSALIVAVISALSFNYFFIPPLHTFTIREPQNWIAFGAFVIAALIVGQLSSRAQEKAAEAESRRLQVEKLYKQLQDAFEEASEAESLRRSEKLKTALLDAVTHDLRTPLTSIKASVSALLESQHGVKSPELSAEVQRELMQVIDEETDRLNHFIEELMSLARIEGDQLRLDRELTSAEEVVNSAIDRAEPHLQSHRVEVTIQQSLPLMPVDAASISGVIYELLENAAKYSPAGSSIHVQARREHDGVEISVEDNGPGVPEPLRERIFEKFFRDPALERSRTGFGMGLAIARGIVEAHGGRIWMETSNIGRGAAVHFRIPYGT